MQTLNAVTVIAHAFFVVYVSYPVLFLLIAYGSRKQSTKVLRELIQTTEKLKNFPRFARYTDWRYAHLCTAFGSDH